MAGRSTTPLQEGRREQGQGRRPVNRRPCPARAQVSPPRVFGPPPQAVTPGPGVADWTLLPIAVGTRRGRILPAREDVRPPESGHQRMLGVRQQQEAVAPPPLYGVQGLGTSDPKTVEADWEGL